MDKNKKKKIAAVIGVMNYLKEKNNAQEIIQVKQNIPSVWSNYSRQLIMTNRNMLQRRVISR